MKAHGKHGFVLVCVLWVLAILTIVTLGFGKRAVLDRRAAAYSLDYEEAMMMARAAVERGTVELRNKAIKDAFRPQQDPGATFLGQPWAKSVNLLTESDYFDLDKESYQDDTVTYIIEDAERFININTAPKEVLEKIKNLDRSAIRRIVKRREKGDNEKDGPVSFQTAEELRYFQGVDEEQWFGENGKPGLRDVLTTYGDGKINVNTASKAVLESIGLDTGAAIRIVNYRNGADREPGTEDDKGFQTLDEVAGKAKVEGKSAEIITTFCKCTSQEFRITGIATRRAGTVRAVCSAMVRIEGQDATVLNWREEALGS